MTQSIDETRFNQALQAAEDAFWQVFAGHYPEITSGDIDPGTLNALETEMRDAARVWLQANSPEGGVRSMNLDEWLAQYQLKRVDLGGGLEGWSYDFADGRQVLLTYGSGVPWGDPADAADAAWVVGMYGTDPDAWVTLRPLTLAAALDNLTGLKDFDPMDHRSLWGMTFGSAEQLWEAARS